MKHTLICLMAALLAMITSCKGNSNGDAEERGIDTIPMMVMQIKECSRLYTAEYKVHKIITHSDTLKLLDIIGSGKRKVAIPIDATLKAYIDFGEFTKDNVSRHNGKIEITLPAPHIVITSSRIDHSSIRQDVSLLRSKFTDEELAGYEKQGRQSISSDIPRMGILQTARRSAATQLIPVFSMLGIPQENIVIKFVNSDKEKGGLTWIMD